VKLLLDTHALLWWLADDERLTARVRKLIADPGNDVVVSVVVLWEIAVKQRIGKLRLDIEEVADAMERTGFALLDITVAHLRTLVRLPTHHRDPFDHLLVAQAITEKATLLSDDRYIPKYGVRTITCSGSAPRAR
jgi:PIN domain nuclease of toxin-antitoxin system